MHHLDVSDPRRTRLPVAAPSVPPPPPFAERRVESRRAEDRLAHEEAALLARALDVLAAERPAEDRLAGLLALLAQTVGARRAAVLATGLERRVAVSLGEDEDEQAAASLAAWLDAEAPRSRADRAASPAAPVSFAIHLAPVGIHDRVGGRPLAAPAPAGLPAAGSAGDRPSATADPTHYVCLPIPGTGSVVLGFDFADPATAASIADRLPPNLARHAAVALALVTEQLATEREMAALRARDAERSRFVSTVAHELRTPLTGLNGYLDLILAGQVADPGVERDFLERSQGIVASMGELVGDLLDLSRLESGMLGLDLRPVSIREVGDRVIDQLTPIAMDSSIKLKVELPPRLRTAVADRRRLEQVVANLAANALKFSPAGSAVVLAGWFDGPVALIAVRDAGSGIGPEDRDRLFERFYRMNGHERVTGTGLGLPIARDLTRAMGGDLDVASVPASGSSFLIALPALPTTEIDAVDAALTRAIAAEEVRLEERAVVRAIRSNGLGTSAANARVAHRTNGRSPTLRAVGGRGAEAEADEPDGPAGDRNGRAPVQRGSGGRPVRLRAIDGTGGRPNRRAPA